MNYKSYKPDVLKALDQAKGKSYELVGESARTGVVDRITKQEQVDTGYMRNSVDYVVKGQKTITVTDNKGIRKDTFTLSNDNDSVIVGSAAEYAPFQDKKKPFLKQGVYDVIGRIEKVVQAVMKEHFK